MAAAVLGFQGVRLSVRPCDCNIARIARVINMLIAMLNQRASLQGCSFNRRESRCGKLHYIAHCGDDPRGDASTYSGGAPVAGDASTYSGGAPAAGVASTCSGGRRSAAFPCRFACCFLAFCDFSPAQARKMRLFLCKREGVFGSRRQCPRDRAPLSCESPRVLNVGVSKIGKTMQINEAGIMGSTCPPYTNKKRSRIFPYGVSADGVCFCTVCCPPCPPCPPVRCCPPVRQCSFLICIWAFLI